MKHTAMGDAGEGYLGSDTRLLGNAESKDEVRAMY